MSLDFILLDNDEAAFLPTFGAAVVTVLPGRLRASGPATAAGKKVCVQGDEGSVNVPGCAYVTATFPLPGMGTLSIARLGTDQTARGTTSGGMAVLLKGSQFTAKFKVQAPATNPAGVMDAVPEYQGQGSFITTNREVQGS